MYKSAIAGLFVLSILTITNSPKASAQTDASSNNQVKLNTVVVTNLQGMQFGGYASEIILKPVEPPKPTAPPAPVPVQHTIEKGETLENIAAANNSTWMRIFNKNTDVADPNTITPGQTIIIPLPDEQLTERPLPVVAPVQTVRASAGAGSTNSVVRSGGSLPVASSAGNRYSAGYCTWYAKNRRPDLPNNLGNADTWVGNAAAQGIATGSTPAVGAIGQQGMHVVYVESVNGDGTVTISEMNYGGWNTVGSRTVPAGSFRYIY